MSEPPTPQPTKDSQQSFRVARRGESSRDWVAWSRRFCVTMSSRKDGAETLGMGLAAKALILLARAYQASLSPYLGRRCRFVPTCSNYFIEAVGRYGAWRGLWLGVRRLLRCHPFVRGGYDPVP